jgi:translation initiation factor 2 subunit 1
MQDTRFYEQKYPTQGDHVVVTITKITELGIYVSLLEYNNIEGMVLLSEVSSRRIKAASKLFRINSKEVVIVLRVDESKGYIDLSKKRVTQYDREACLTKFSKSRIVYGIAKHVASLNNITLDEINSKFIYKLYSTFSHAYNAFEHFSVNLEDLNEYNLEEKLKQDLIKTILFRFSLVKLKISSQFKINCFQETGIDAIKEALLEGRINNDIKIQLVSSPTYLITVLDVDENKGKNILKECLEKINKSIVSKGGQFEIKIYPRIIDINDEEDVIDTEKKKDVKLNTDLSSLEDDDD